MTVDEIFSEFKRPADLARAVGAKPGMGRVWKKRGAIPAAYWIPLIAVMRQKGKTLTREQLSALPKKETDRGKKT